MPPEQLAELEEDETLRKRLAKFIARPQSLSAVASLADLATLAGVSPHFSLSRKARGSNFVKRHAVMISTSHDTPYVATERARDLARRRVHKPPVVY
jgi:hypothetical protein